MTEHMYNPASDNQLASEARRWDAGDVDPRGWHDAPEAIPHGAGTTPISLRLPAPMLAILKEFARREGIGYQVLMKRWLDDRIRQERDALARKSTTYKSPRAQRRPRVLAEGPDRQQPDTNP